MSDEDCYIFIDPSVPENKQAISIMCVKCHKEKMPDTGSFYKGSEAGYSNFDWKCCFCNKIIHKAEGDNEQN
jgi:hypothetical protein